MRHMMDAMHNTSGSISLLSLSPFHFRLALGPHTVLPHRSFLHNIVTFLECAHLPGGLSLERLQSFARPPTQTEQIEQIKAVTSMRYARNISSRPGVYWSENHLCVEVMSVYKQLKTSSREVRSKNVWLPLFLLFAVARVSPPGVPPPLPPCKTAFLHDVLERPSKGLRR